MYFLANKLYKNVFGQGSTLDQLRYLDFPTLDRIVGNSNSGSCSTHISTSRNSLVVCYMWLSRFFL